MRKTLLISLLMVVILTLSACAGAATDNPTNGDGIPANGTPNPNATPPGAFQAAPLSVQEQVLIGTFKMESTENAVSAEQAKNLLPLWQTLKALSSSDTVAAEELNALYQQIQDTMTPGQLSAITAMNLTRNDLFTLMQEQGIELTGGFGGRGNGQNGQGQNGQRPEGFAPPEGFVPGQGGGGMPQNLSAEQQATMEARMTQRADNVNRIPSALIDALIQLLESKVQ